MAMRWELMGWWRRLVCGRFGHRVMVEVRGRIPFYVCERCGRDLGEARGYVGNGLWD